MKIIVLAMLLSLNACVSGVSGKLVATEGALAVSKDAKVNVTRLDLTSAADSESMQVFIGEVNLDGTFTVSLDANEGEYLVEAVVPGYAVSSQKIALADQKEVTMQLVPVGKPSASMIGTNMDADVGVGSGGATLTPPSL
jgi:hypothetical protein